MTDETADRLREKTVDSEQIYEGKVVSLKVDEVQLPDGARSRREIVIHRGAVAAVPLTGDGRVVLVRQWRHPAGKALLEIPAGTLEEGESPETTLQRELAEEIGHTAGEIEHLSDIYTAPGYSSEIIGLYIATDLVPTEGQADEDENIEIVQMPLDEALRMCTEGELRDGKSVAALLLTAARRAQ